MDTHTHVVFLHQSETQLCGNFTSRELGDGREVKEPHLNPTASCWISFLKQLHHAALRRSRESKCCCSCCGGGRGRGIIITSDSQTHVLTKPALRNKCLFNINFICLIFSEFILFILYSVLVHIKKKKKKVFISFIHQCFIFLWVLYFLSFFKNLFPILSVCVYNF